MITKNKESKPFKYTLAFKQYIQLHSDHTLSKTFTDLEALRQLAISGNSIENVLKYYIKLLHLRNCVSQQHITASFQWYDVMTGELLKSKNIDYEISCLLLHTIFFLFPLVYVIRDNSLPYKQCYVILKKVIEYKSEDQLSSNSLFFSSTKSLDLNSYFLEGFKAYCAAKFIMIEAVEELGGFAEPDKNKLSFISQQYYTAHLMYNNALKNIELFLKSHKYEIEDSSKRDIKTHIQLIEAYSSYCISSSYYHLSKYYYLSDEISTSFKLIDQSKEFFNEKLYKKTGIIDRNELESIKNQINETYNNLKVQASYATDKTINIQSLFAQSSDFDFDILDIFSSLNKCGNIKCLLPEEQINIKELELLSNKENMISQFLLLESELDKKRSSLDKNNCCKKINCMITEIKHVNYEVLINDIKILCRIIESKFIYLNNLICDTQLTSGEDISFLSHEYRKCLAINNKINNFIEEYNNISKIKIPSYYEKLEDCDLQIEIKPLQPFLNYQFDINDYNIQLIKGKSMNKYFEDAILEVKKINEINKKEIENYIYQLNQIETIIMDKSMEAKELYQTMKNVREIKKKYKKIETFGKRIIKELKLIIDKIEKIEIKMDSYNNL
ncbi:hypothetical protein TCON_2236 [Astathelohania contejeani]|uniref:BRO1 domain-containing protein n=1 Tax=Astathelohania contejeani TaxID=164912 RepID=A0ABQ7HWJ6_9MICR|nr:hypothetical protein TCON_2236 [Thelohania contejeani]